MPSAGPPQYKITVTNHSSESTGLLRPQSEDRPDSDKGCCSLKQRWKRKLVAVVSVVVVVCFIIVVTYNKNVTNGTSGGNDSIETSSSRNTHHEFPIDFVWGSATSSYQVEGAVHEGGRGKTIWDTYCKEPGHVLNHDTGDVACDHYHRYEEDVRLMKNIGLQAYRFSIAWSRILPNGTATGSSDVNVAGIQFYNKLINTLLANDIEPWATLYHWDLPQGLEDIGTGNGWLNDRAEDTIDAFANYSRICYQHFGDRVKKWITINEPWTVAIHGYNDGIKAPGRTKYGSTEPYIVAHNLLLAHAKAVQIYREEFQPKQQGVIGMAANADFRYPRTDTPEDHDAADRSILFQLGWFVDPIMKGDYPEVMRQRLGNRLPQFTKEQSEQLLGSYDFLGLNTYSSALAANPQEDGDKATTTQEGYWADAHVNLTSDPSWDRNYMGWSIVPDGTRGLLLWITHRYNRPLIYITENGSAEDEPDLETALHDEKRRRFFEGNLRACAEAIEAGANLKGYFAWSLMDNFEWEYGYRRRFGICRVDFDTQVRTPKLSAVWYSQTIQANGANIARNNSS